MSSQKSPKVNPDKIVSPQMNKLLSMFENNHNTSDGNDSHKTSHKLVKQTPSKLVNPFISGNQSKPRIERKPISHPDSSTAENQTSEEEDDFEDAKSTEVASVNSMENDAPNNSADSTISGPNDEDITSSMQYIEDNGESSILDNQLDPDEYSFLANTPVIDLENAGVEYEAEYSPSEQHMSLGKRTESIKSPPETSADENPEHKQIGLAIHSQKNERISPIPNSYFESSSEKQQAKADEVEVDFNFFEENDDLNSESKFVEKGEETQNQINESSSNKYFHENSDEIIDVVSAQNVEINDKVKSGDNESKEAFLGTSAELETNLDENRVTTNSPALVSEINSLKTVESPVDSHRSISQTIEQIGEVESTITNDEPKRKKYAPQFEVDDDVQKDDELSADFSTDNVNKEPAKPDFSFAKSPEHNDSVNFQNLNKEHTDDNIEVNESNEPQYKNEKDDNSITENKTFTSSTVQGNVCMVDSQPDEIDRLNLSDENQAESSLRLESSMKNEGEEYEDPAIMSENKAETVDSKPESIWKEDTSLENSFELNNPKNIAMEMLKENKITSENTSDLASKNNYVKNSIKDLPENKRKMSSERLSQDEVSQLNNEITLHENSNLLGAKVSSDHSEDERLKGNTKSESLTSSTVDLKSDLSNSSDINKSIHINERVDAVKYKIHRSKLDGNEENKGKGVPTGKDSEKILSQNLDTAKFAGATEPNFNNESSFTNNQEMNENTDIPQSVESDDVEDLNDETNKNRFINNFAGDNMNFDSTSEAERSDTYEVGKTQKFQDPAFGYISKKQSSAILGSTDSSNDIGIEIDESKEPTIRSCNPGSDSKSILTNSNESGNSEISNKILTDFENQDHERTEFFNEENIWKNHETKVGKMTFNSVDSASSANEENSEEVDSMPNRMLTNEKLSRDVNHNVDEIVDTKLSNAADSVANQSIQSPAGEDFDYKIRESVDSEISKNLSTEVGTDKDADSKIRRDENFEAEKDVNYELDKDSNPKITTDIGSHVNEDANSKVDASADPEISQTSNSKIEKVTEYKADEAVDSTIEETNCEATEDINIELNKGISSNNDVNTNYQNDEVKPTLSDSISDESVNRISQDMEVKTSLNTGNNGNPFISEDYAEDSFDSEVSSINSSSSVTEPVLTQFKLGTRRSNNEKHLGTEKKYNSSIGARQSPLFSPKFGKPASISGVKKRITPGNSPLLRSPQFNNRSLISPFIEVSPAKSNNTTVQDYRVKSPSINGSDKRNPYGNLSPMNGLKPSEWRSSSLNINEAQANTSKALPASRSPSNIEIIPYSPTESSFMPLSPKDKEHKTDQIRNLYSKNSRAIVAESSLPAPYLSTTKFSDSPKHDPTKNVVFGVCLCDFNHTRGPEIEYWIDEDNEYDIVANPADREILSSKWPVLPFQALPDGSHEFEETFSYFNILYDEKSKTTINNICDVGSKKYLDQYKLSDEKYNVSNLNKMIRNNLQKDEMGTDLIDFNETVITLWAISCVRQISSDQLTNKSADVTRTAVQKGIVIICRQPIFGQLKEKLSIITKSLFLQQDFTDKSLLKILFENLRNLYATDKNSLSLKREENIKNSIKNDNANDGIESNLKEQDFYVGLRLKELIHKFRRSALVIFKSILLEKKILFFSKNIENLCLSQFSFISLIPNLISNLNDSGSPYLNFDELNLIKSLNLKTSNRYSFLGFLGLPLLPFGFGGVFNPYTPLQQLDDLLNESKINHYTIGTSNDLLLGQKEKYCDVLVNLDTGSVEIISKELIPSLTLSSADKKFIDLITRNVDRFHFHSKDSSDIEDGDIEYNGSDDYIRIFFEEYLLSMLSAAKYDKFLKKLGLKEADNEHLTTSPVQFTNDSSKMILDDVNVNNIDNFNAEFISEWSKTSNYNAFDSFTDNEIFYVFSPLHVSLTESFLEAKEDFDKNYGMNNLLDGFNILRANVQNRLQNTSLITRSISSEKSRPTSGMVEGVSSGVTDVSDSQSTSKRNSVSNPSENPRKFTSLESGSFSLEDLNILNSINDEIEMINPLKSTSDNKDNAENTKKPTNGWMSSWSSWVKR